MAEQTAKLFKSGRSQAVRLPKEFRFAGDEVYIRRDPNTGEVILSERPTTWDGLFALYAEDDVPDDFMDPKNRRQPPQERDPFEGWEE